MHVLRVKKKKKKKMLVRNFKHLRIKPLTPAKGSAAELDALKLRSLRCMITTCFMSLFLSPRAVCHLAS